MRSVAIFTIVLLFVSMSAASQTFTYTNSDTGLNNIAIGYEVPLPIDSLTPIEGFRTYDSLAMRHLQLAEMFDVITQIQIGQTINNRPIFAYRLGDPDNLTVDGNLEGAALVNGGIHAREWQSPEAVTGYIEYLAETQNDKHVSQFILENVNFVVIPVLNVDGFLQTQRFPNQVTDSQTTPRDGRMRRKNMRDVDESISSDSDNLDGIDLNRNNAPFWATSNRSSSDITSLVYHGGSNGSEPETMALYQGAVEAGEDRLRFYIDTHSFSQIYFAPYTSNARRNTINDQIARTMRAANDFKYEYGPSGSGAGIGSTDEYFANTYQAVSYTLEIEPANSNTQYGGTGISHGGFILPNSEVPRMREETRKATIAGLYSIAYPPAVTGFDIVDVANQTIVFSGQWQKQGDARELILSQSQPLLAQTDYTLRISFNKPMRQLDSSTVVGFPPLSDALGMSLSLSGVANGEEVAYDMDTQQGQWLVDEGYARYKTDTFEQPFSLPQNFVWDQHSLLAIAVETADFSGQNVDSDSATIVDWQNGAWTMYEDNDGRVNNDIGGTSKSTRLINDGSDLFAPINPPAPPTPAPPVPTPETNSGGGGPLSILGLALAIYIMRSKRQ
ncbi:M14 family zinc carboxypeptidase, partial [Aliiglaciecola sp.]|nr:M14 family zinc carboxypeptidase [Aliiglaciecola sp.]